VPGFRVFRLYRNVFPFLVTVTRNLYSVISLCLWQTLLTEDAACLKDNDGKTLIHIAAESGTCHQGPITYTLIQSHNIGFHNQLKIDIFDFLVIHFTVTINKIVATEPKHGKITIVNLNNSSCQGV